MCARAVHGFVELAEGIHHQGLIAILAVPQVLPKNRQSPDQRSEPCDHSIVTLPYRLVGQVVITKKTLIRALAGQHAFHTMLAYELGHHQERHTVRMPRKRILVVIEHLGCQVDKIYVPCFDYQQVQIQMFGKCGRRRPFTQWAHHIGMEYREIGVLPRGHRHQHRRIHAATT